MEQNRKKKQNKLNFDGHLDLDTDSLTEKKKIFSKQFRIRNFSYSQFS